MSTLSLTPKTRVVVVGLGYVGLPLAVALAHKFTVIGFDISEQRVSELKDGFDRTEEITTEKLKASSIVLTNSVNDITDASIYIVTVPTPVDKQNKPDLTPVMSACEILGPIIGKNSIVVFESTVYPGVTEE
jgi:UDP-N-acetyl-D-glucosamine/UDP-N-acetyl-D-galactosamine dehydrogenase